MDSLLIEIGTEEIPAGYIEPALQSLAALLKQKLTEARIDHGDSKVLGTPRRLAVIIENVAESQRKLKTEVVGPPEKVGFDPQGKPTLAAEKFAEKVGIQTRRIKLKQTERGRYLCAVKTERGIATSRLLKDMLPSVILAVPFPKSMRWADQDFQFARPIHSILSLLGNRVIPFSLGNIRSGRHTFGHSFLNPGRIKIESPDRYEACLREAHVVVDIQKRKKKIEVEIGKAARRMDGALLPDPELVDIVNNLVELPAISIGAFDKKFLALPKEILITAMREHQKYFAVADPSGQLMPAFIAVNNTPVKDRNLVARGHERVLRARLEDAQFFYNSDLGMPLDEGVEKLKGVLFQAALGSVYEKVTRVQKLSEFIVKSNLNPQNPDGPPPGLLKDVSRAAVLCKVDLVSQVVGEFPRLQGVMGSIYASKAGEPEAVARAIEEHYQPTYSGGPLPKTETGAILSIADKLDTICGCFRVGLIPTGTSDPYALRRQGIGVVQIMLNRQFLFPLTGVLEKSLSLLGETDEKARAALAGQVYLFIKNRIINLLTEEKFSRDIISAVVGTSVDRIPEVWTRTSALQSLKTKPDFEPLAAAFKRVVNIIKQAEQKGLFDRSDTVDHSLFADPCEERLYRDYRKVEQKVSGNLTQGNIEGALLDVASLRQAVDDFFDGVLVMSEDVKLRKNRLALLGRIAALFAKFADFSKIST